MSVKVVRPVRDGGGGVGGVCAPGAKKVHLMKS